MRRIIIFLAIASCYCIEAQCQVTAGSDKPPVKGALLDIKQKDPDAANINSEKGIALPRVSLEKTDDLKPCIDIAGVANPAFYKGLTVYNTNGSTGGFTQAGIYVWSGKKWFLVHSIVNRYEMGN